MEFEFVKEWIDRGDKEENYIFKFFAISLLSIGYTIKKQTRIKNMNV